MIRYQSFAVVVLVIAVSTPVSVSQTDKKPAAKPATQTAPKEDEPNPLAAQRRTVATSLLTSLAEEARSYHDQTLRARIQARAADALWDSDVEKARPLFRRAWESASAADKEALRKYDEQRQRQRDSKTQTYIQPPPNLRSEVLRLAALRDPDLSEQFLAALAEENERATTSGATSGSAATTDPEHPPIDVENRLGLARQLLNSGDIGRSLLFADKVLDRVTTRGIFFLCALREKDQAAADERFARMLASAVANPTSDAAHVSVLSSYVFTPFLYIIVRESGSHASKERDQIVPPNISPELRLQFLKGGALILLRPIAPRDQDRTVAGRTGLYFTIARLLPLYEQYAPDLAPELRVQLAALGADVSEGWRTGREELLREGLVPRDQTRDEGQEALENVERAANAQDRDSLYARAAMAAAHKGDLNARNIVDKISSVEFRKSARAYVDFALIGELLKAKDVNEAMRLISSAELTHIQRVYSLIEASKLFKKTDPARAAEVLEEAATTARRIGGSDPDRSRALVGVATQMWQVDRARVWEALLEAVKAANSAPQFTGEDAHIVSRLQTSRGNSTTSFNVDDFDLPGIFTFVAREDLYRSIELAKNFSSDAPRATATLAIARAVLAMKS